MSCSMHCAQVHRMAQWGTFGEMALVDVTYTTPATIKADTPVIALKVLRNDFFQVMHSFEEDTRMEEQERAEAEART